jgi:hypothetical protein
MRCGAKSAPIVEPGRHKIKGIGSQPLAVPGAILIHDPGTQACDGADRVFEPAHLRSRTQAKRRPDGGSAGSRGVPEIR